MAVSASIITGEASILSLSGQLPAQPGKSRGVPAMAARLVEPLSIVIEQQGLREAEPRCLGAA